MVSSALLCRLLASGSSSPSPRVPSPHLAAVAILHGIRLPHNTLAPCCESWDDGYPPIPPIPPDPPPDPPPNQSPESPSTNPPSHLDLHTSPITNQCTIRLMLLLHAATSATILPFRLPQFRPPAIARNGNWTISDLASTPLTNTKGKNDVLIHSRYLYVSNYLCFILRKWAFSSTCLQFRLPEVSSRTAKLLGLDMLNVIMHLWKSRNALCFEYRETLAITLAHRILTFPRAWEAAQQSPLHQAPNPCHINRIPAPQKPRTRSLQSHVCMVDAAWQATTLKCGQGWTLLSANEEVISKRSATQSFAYSALRTESLVLEAAISAAFLMDIQHLQVYSDYLTLVSLLNSFGGINELKNVIVDIKSLQRTFSSIFFFKAVLCTLSQN